jgi:hypothetical protein
MTQETKKPRPEFDLDPLRHVVPGGGDVSWRQGQLALAFSTVLDVFQDAADKAPHNFAEERVRGSASEDDIHRAVIDRLQQVHFLMQSAIVRGYRGD